jgi:hypothetical protein
MSFLRGVDLSRCGYFLPQPFHWYSPLQDLELVGMFYAGRAIAGKFIFPIDTFS